jgi:hypothetical protein
LAEIKDLSKEEQEKKAKELENSKKSSWFNNVPPWVKVAGVLVIIVKYLQISSKGGNLQELWVWIIGVIAVWWLLGQSVQKMDSGILTPEQAENALKAELERKRREGQIDKHIKYYVDVNNALFHNDGLPYYYTIAVLFVGNNFKEYKRGTVYAQGDTKGFATIQTPVTKVSGLEQLNVKILPDKNWKFAQRYGFDKLLMGEWKK